MFDYDRISTNIAKLSAEVKRRRSFYEQERHIFLFSRRSLGDKDYALALLVQAEETMEQYLASIPSKVREEIHIP